MMDQMGNTFSVTATIKSWMRREAYSFDRPGREVPEDETSQVSLFTSSSLANHAVIS